MRSMIVAVLVSALSAGCVSTGGYVEVNGHGAGMAQLSGIVMSAYEAKNRATCPNGPTYENRYARVESRGPNPRYDSRESPGYVYVSARGEYECR